MTTTDCALASHSDDPFLQPPADVSDAGVLAWAAVAFDADHHKQLPRDVVTWFLLRVLTIDAVCLWTAIGNPGVQFALRLSSRLRDHIDPTGKQRQELTELIRHPAPEARFGGPVDTAMSPPDHTVYRARGVVTTVEWHTPPGAAGYVLRGTVI